MSPASHSRPNYGAIFISLAVLTVIEIFVANLEWVKIVIVLSLISLAILKAGLVAMFYMHLRFEKMILVFIAIIPFLFSIILIIGIGFDIGHP